jgi:membrane protein YqaA with SNARE-associated domain
VDSAVVGIPAGPDALVMLLSFKQPPHAWLVVATATAGAIGGQLFRYSVARKAGDLALRRFDPDWRVGAHRAIDSHGTWTVFLANLAPPPFPMSFVTMAAGAFQLRVVPFLVGCVPGRVIRYGFMGWLGVHYGAQAANVLRENVGLIAGILLGSALVAGLLGVRAWRRRADAQAG